MSDVQFRMTGPLFGPEFTRVSAKHLTDAFVAFQQVQGDRFNSFANDLTGVGRAVQVLVVFIGVIVEWRLLWSFRDLQAASLTIEAGTVGPMIFLWLTLVNITTTGTSCLGIEGLLHLLRRGAKQQQAEMERALREARSHDV